MGGFDRTYNHWACAFFQGVHQIRGGKKSRLRERMEVDGQMKRNPREIYCLYFPDEGRYTRLMTLAEAKKLVREFCTAYIVNIETAEVIY